ERRQVAEPLSSMKLARPGRGAAQGPFGAGIDRHVLAPSDLAQDPGVAGGLGGADVAADRSHGQQVEVRRGEGGQQPGGVVHARVAINDQALFHRPDVPPAAARINRASPDQSSPTIEVQGSTRPASTSATLTAGQPMLLLADTRQAADTKSRSSDAPAASRSVTKTAPRGSDSLNAPAFSMR